MPRPKRDLPWLDLREGVYYAFWYNETKRRTDRLSLRTQDRQTALDRFAAFLTSGIDGVKPPTAGTTIDEVLDNYDTEHLQRASVNHAKHVSTLVNLRAHFGPVDVSDVDIPMCRRYADRRRAGDIGWSNASPATVRKELTILIAALHHAVKWKRLKRDDVPYIERPPISESRLRWLSHNELDALRNVAVAQDLKDFIELAYYTAARRDSLENLSIFQINLKAGVIDLNPPGRRRTKKRKPIVPIYPEIRAILERRLGDAAGQGANKLFDRNLYYLFRQAVVAAGMDTHGPNKVTPHTLRHTRASHLLMSGAPPYAVAGLLGDTVDMVLKVYGHICPDYLRETFLQAPSVQ